MMDGSGLYAAEEQKILFPPLICFHHLNLFPSELNLFSPFSGCVTQGKVFNLSLPCASASVTPAPIGLF